MSDTSACDRPPPHPPLKDAAHAQCERCYAPQGPGQLPPHWPEEFNTYLHELFGSPIPSNIRPDYAFSDDHGRYHLEVFLDTPDGMILAVHLDSGPAGEVDVLTFRKYT